MKIRNFILSSLTFFTSLMSFHAAAETPTNIDHSSLRLRTDTPSGLPVPRFVSLKNKKTYCRSGPSFSHQVRYTFIQKDAPVLVIAETVDHWRKLRDREGDECWAHKMVLKAPRKAFVTKQAVIRVKPNSTSKVRAHLAQNALVTVETTKDGWTRVNTGVMRGWMEDSALWGLRGSALQNTSSN